MITSIPLRNTVVSGTGLRKLAIATTPAENARKSNTDFNRKRPGEKSRVSCLTSAGSPMRFVTFLFQCNNLANISTRKMTKTRARRYSICSNRYFSSGKLDDDQTNTMLTIYLIPLKNSYWVNMSLSIFIRMPAISIDLSGDSIFITKK